MQVNWVRANLPFGLKNEDYLLLLKGLLDVIDAMEKSAEEKN